MVSARQFITSHYAMVPCSTVHHQSLRYGSLLESSSPAITLWYLLDSSSPVITLWYLARQFITSHYAMVPCSRVHHQPLRYGICSTVHHQSLRYGTLLDSSSPVITLWYLA